MGIRKGQSPDSWCHRKSPTTKGMLKREVPLTCPSPFLSVCFMTHRFVYARWSCEEGTFKSESEIERIIRPAFCYLGAGKGVEMKKKCKKLMMDIFLGAQEFL